MINANIKTDSSELTIRQETNFVLYDGNPISAILELEKVAATSRVVMILLLGRED